MSGGHGCATGRRVQHAQHPREAIRPTAGPQRPAHLQAGAAPVELCLTRPPAHPRRRRVERPGGARLARCPAATAAVHQGRTQHARLRSRHPGAPATAVPKA